MLGTCKLRDLRVESGQAGARGADNKQLGHRETSACNVPVVKSLFIRRGARCRRAATCFASGRSGRSRAGR